MRIPTLKVSPYPFMRKFHHFSVFAVVLGAVPLALGQPPATPHPAPELAKADSLDQLQALRKSARTPEEKVALVDAWLKAHPPTASTRPMSKATFQVRMAALNAQPVPPKPSDEKGALAWEARQGLTATLAMARSPQEAVALTEEFRRLNADVLRELVPRMPTREEIQTSRAQAAVAHPSARPGNLQDEIAEVLRETRAEARTPSETVALTAEFLRLNAKAIAEAYSKNQKNNPPE